MGEKKKKKKEKKDKEKEKKKEKATVRSAPDGSDNNSIACILDIKIILFFSFTFCRTCSPIYLRRHYIQCNVAEM